MEVTEIPPPLPAAAKSDDENESNLELSSTILPKIVLTEIPPPFPTALKFAFE